MAGSLEKEIKIKLTIDGKDANTTLQISGDLYDKLIQKTNKYQEKAAGASSTTRGFTSDTTAMNQALVQFGSVLGTSDILLGEFKGKLNQISETIIYTGKLLNTVGEAYNKYYSSLESNTKKEIDDWQKNEKKKLENEKKTALRHARTSKQKEKINEEYDRKEQELENQAKVRLKEKLEVWFAWQKAASIAQATINTYEGATKALAQGGVFGALMAGAVIASGLTNIAVISSQKMPGYKKGGAIVGEDGPEIIAPFQDYASGQSKLITMTMMTLRDEIRSSPINPPGGDFRKLEEAIVRLNKRLDEGIDARAYLDDKQAKRIVNRGSAMSRRSKI